MKDLAGAAVAVLIFSGLFTLIGFVGYAVYDHVQKKKGCAIVFKDRRTKGIRIVEDFRWVHVLLTIFQQAVPIQNRYQNPYQRFSFNGSDEIDWSDYIIRRKSSTVEVAYLRRSGGKSTSVAFDMFMEIVNMDKYVVGCTTNTVAEVEYRQVEAALEPHIHGDLTVGQKIESPENAFGIKVHATVTCIFDFAEARSKEEALVKKLEELATTASRDNGYHFGEAETTKKQLQDLRKQIADLQKMDMHSNHIRFVREHWSIPKCLA